MNSAAKDVRVSGEPQGKPVVPAVLSRVFIPSLLLVLAMASSSFAQMRTPVIIRAGNVIHDEYGNVLAGSSAISPSKRSLVEVLWSSNSVINPPAYDGTPSPGNPQVDGGVSGIGTLISPALPRPGRFAAALANPRPVQNSRFFVRVYNGPTLEESSFYADSQVLRVNDNDVLVALVGDTVNPIDPRDFDGDGLNNSWEKSLKTDPNNRDTDGDGVSDNDEFLAATDALDGESYFTTFWIGGDANGNAALKWVSAPGKRYVVEALDPAEPGWTHFVPVTDTIRAEGYETQASIPNGLVSEHAIYRVRLVLE